MSSVSKTTPEVSRQLAKFTASFQWDDVPEHVRHEAKRSLLNYFATALSACYDPTIEKAVNVYGSSPAEGTLPSSDVLSGWMY